jgi:hypothetical protein
MIKTIIKIAGAVADAWNTYQTLKREDLRGRVDSSPDAEWMRQFNPGAQGSVRGAETEAGQSADDSQRRDHDGQK